MPPDPELQVRKLLFASGFRYRKILGLLPAEFDGCAT